MEQSWRYMNYQKALSTLKMLIKKKSIEQCIETVLTATLNTQPPIPNQLPVLPASTLNSLLFLSLYCPGSPGDRLLLEGWTYSVPWQWYCPGQAHGSLFPSVSVNVWISEQTGAFSFHNFLLPATQTHEPGMEAPEAPSPSPGLCPRSPLSSLEFLCSARLSSLVPRLQRHKEQKGEACKGPLKW